MPNRSQYQRYKSENPEKVKAERKASYERRKEKERAAHKEWARQPEVAVRRAAASRQALQKNPERRAKKIAKDILSRAMGVSQKILPDALVDAEVERLRLVKIIREIKTERTTP